MSFDIRENWSEQSLTKDREIKSWKAQRGFTVVGPTDEVSAQTASAEFLIGYPHPRNPFLRVQNAKADQQGFGLWHVVLQYGYNAPDSPDNPINKLPIIEWEFGSTTEPVDRDIDDNGIRNSAGDAPENPPQNEFPTQFFTITINMPYFDNARRQQYVNRINSDVATINGIGIFQPGILLCRAISPKSSYTEADLFVPVAHRFEIRDDDAKLNTDFGIYDGFMVRFIDQGKRALYQSAGGPVPGLIYAADQQDPTKKVTNPIPVSEDIRLDGYGNFFDSSNGHKVTEAFVDGVDGPHSPDGASVEVLPNGVFLKYRVKKAVSFAGLTF